MGQAGQAQDRIHGDPEGFSRLLVESALKDLRCRGSPGRYSITLAERGYKVTLFNLSKACLRFAERKSRKTGVKLADYAQAKALDESSIHGLSLSTLPDRA